MESKHTPGKWDIAKDRDDWWVTSNNGDICYMNQSIEVNQRKANAQFIVQACNAHDELLEACKTMLKYEWGFKQFFEGTNYAELQEKADKLTNMLQHAIAKTEGKEVER